MSEQHAQFQGSIPEFYDRHLGPILFHDYADDLAGRVAALDPGRVLELAAGTGIATRRLRDRLPPDTEVVATDLNQPMLDHAGAKFAPGEAVTFQPADACDLPFGDDSFEAVVCQYGIMFFPDKPKSLAEVMRVLRPGGRYVFNVWDRLEVNDLPRLAQAEVEKAFPEDPPGFYHVPFSMWDLNEIKALLLAAGFAEIAFHVLPKAARSESAAHAAAGFVRGNPLALEIAERGASTDKLEAALAAAFAAAHGEAPVEARMQGIVVVALRP